MWTADWWWEIQVHIRVVVLIKKTQTPSKGATLVPIILASDKTQLTRFSGDQQAWPLYLTIGNIDKETRRRPSSRANRSLGLHSKEALFHDWRTMLQSLKAAGRDGVRMDCADGFVRKMYLTAYIADYPEQCLVCCCGENSCPGCTCAPKLSTKGSGDM
ncbi:hypothetical protein B0H14DRAFT_3086402 [Mycena olivaceomarginata]|nr:hypothetical protein B0H14DRAFT_3086402 [Mycena olivaceomarginata]